MTDSQIRSGRSPATLLDTALLTLLEDPAIAAVRLELRDPLVGMVSELPRRAPLAGLGRIEIPVTSEDGAVLGELRIYLAPGVATPDLLVTELRTVSQLISGLVATQHELASARQAAQEAAHLAERDELTGVGNRRAWIRALNSEALRCRRHPRPAAVLVVDLDRLKGINDQRGHAAGDAVLRRAAEVLQATSRGSDPVCRLGGDEFAVLAVETDQQAALTLAQRLRRALEQAGVAASIGWAVSPDGTEPAGAWSAADGAMYADKLARRASPAP